MPDRLWTTRDTEDLADWRPERPEAPRPRPERKPLPERAPAPASEAPTEVDVTAAAHRVRGVRPQEPTNVPAATGTPPVNGSAPAADGIGSRNSDHATVDIGEAAKRIRERQPIGAGGGAVPPPASGSPFAARSRPAPPVAAPPPRRGWVAPFLSALVGALVVVVVFLIFFRDGSTNDAGEPLPATAGAGGASANARAVYKSAADSVVSIRAKMAAGQATGTGFLVDGRDTIVTNAHVVGTADSVSVQFGDRGQIIRGRVLGKDVSTDLAVVRIDPAEHTSNPLPLADSDNVRVGDAVVAIGNPFGLDRTATAGIVSATGRHISAPNGFDIDNVIQTDAPINPGNSGGPLLDARGRVIGINSQIATAGGSNGNVGIGFAVPVNTLRRVVPQLEQGKTIRRAFLGVSTTQGTRGAKVVEVTPSGPADTAGIRAGDEIVRVDGKVVTGSDEVGPIIEGLKPGDSTQVVVVRNGDEQTIDVKLGTRPGG